MTEKLTLGALIQEFVLLIYQPYRPLTYDCQAWRRLAGENGFPLGVVGCLQFVNKPVQLTGFQGIERVDAM